MKGFGGFVLCFLCAYQIVFPYKNFPPSPIFHLYWVIYFPITLNLIFSYNSNLKRGITHLIVITVGSRKRKMIQSFSSFPPFQVDENTVSALFSYEFCGIEGVYQIYIFSITRSRFEEKKSYLIFSVEYRPHST